jgi:hypothetical protein
MPPWEARLEESHLFFMHVSYYNIERKRSRVLGVVVCVCISLLIII